MIALFMESVAHGFFVRFAAGKLQQLNGFVLEGLAQIAEAFRAKVKFCFNSLLGFARDI